MIESVALSWSHGLEEIILNEGLEVINDDLCNCDHLKHLYIPKTVREVNPEKCTAVRVANSSFELEVDIDNPYLIADNGVLYSKDKNKAICVYERSAETLNIDKDTKIIGPLFCWGLSKLQSITLPDGLLEIGHRAFDSCTRLRELDIPKSVNKIDFRAFDDCESLESMVVHALTPPEVIDAGQNKQRIFSRDIKNCVLYVPAESIEAYKASWRGFKNICPL